MPSTIMKTARERNAGSPVPRRRVLLVDGDAPTREALRKAMLQWSFVTTTAATFREARKFVLTEDPFTVIVCDYHLPDGDGLEFFDWLHRQMLIQVPFLLTSSGVPRARLASGDYEFLGKPFSLLEFRQRLDKLSQVKPQSVTSFALTATQEAMASVYARSKSKKRP